MELVTKGRTAKYGPRAQSKKTKLMHPVEALSTPIAIKVSPKQKHLKPNNVTKARVSSNKIHGVDLSVWILQFGQMKSITTVQAPWPVFRSALRNLKNGRMELNDRDYINNRGTGSLRGVEISRLPSRPSGKNRMTRQSIGYWRRKSTAEMAFEYAAEQGRKGYRIWAEFLILNSAGCRRTNWCFVPNGHLLETRHMCSNHRTFRSLTFVTKYDYSPRLTENTWFLLC